MRVLNKISAEIEGVGSPGFRDEVRVFAGGVGQHPGQLELIVDGRGGESRIDLDEAGVRRLSAALASFTASRAAQRDKLRYGCWPNEPVD
jgi:hypothetical protein